MAPNLGWTDVPLGARLARGLGVSIPVRGRQRRRPGRPRRAPARGGRRARTTSSTSRARSASAAVRSAGGRPLTGAAGYAGEIGHLPVNPGGSPCRCGSIGCWETEVGEGALLSLAGLPPDSGRDGVETVLRRGRRGDPAALAALEHVGRWLGIGLAGLVNMLNPRVVVLGAMHGRIYPPSAGRPGGGAGAPGAPGARAPWSGSSPRRWAPMHRCWGPPSWRSSRSSRTRPRSSAGPGAVPTSGERLVMARRHRSSVTVEASAGRAGRRKGWPNDVALRQRHQPSVCGTTPTVVTWRRKPAWAFASWRPSRAWQPSWSAPARARGSTPAPRARGGGGTAADCTVGVSWNNYQEERWAKWDEPAIKAAIEAGGGKYINNDAKSSAETQASNVENLISQGAKVVIVLAQDGTAIKPAVTTAISNGVPVIAYDRLIEDPGALYITFDNKLVGKLAGRRPCSRSRTPRATSSIIKGNKADANADFLRAGMVEAAPGRRGRAPATSRTSVRPTPTTGIPRTPRPRWSSS